MIKKKSLQILSFGFFIVSLIYSIMLLTSQAHDIQTFILNLVQAVLIDGFKMVSFFFAVSEMQKSKLVSGVLFSIVFIALFSISIVGSLGFMYNNSLESTMIDTQKSSGYMRNEELYNSKIAEIESLNNQMQATSNSFDEQINSLPSDYITAKRNLGTDKQNALLEMQNRIDIANSDLQQLNANFSTIQTADVSVSGYNAIFTQIAKMMNESKFADKKQYTSQDISFSFFICVSIIFEVSAVLCYLKSQQVKDDIKAIHNTANNKNNIGFFGNSQEVQANRVKNSSPTLSAENSIEGTKEYNLYIQKMLENTKKTDDNYKTIGYRKIGNLAGLTTTQTNQIYNYLKQNNDIAVIDMNTCLNSNDLIDEFENKYKKKIGFVQQ